MQACSVGSIELWIVNRSGLNFTMQWPMMFTMDVEMFPYKTICWNETGPVNFSRAELCHRLMIGETFNCLQELPLTTLRAVPMRCTRCECLQTEVTGSCIELSQSSLPTDKNSLECIHCYNHKTRIQSILNQITTGGAQICTIDSSRLSSKGVSSAKASF